MRESSGIDSGLLATLGLLMLASLAVGCGIAPRAGGERLDSPKTAVDVMSAAVRGNDLERFAFSMSEETLMEYETAIQIYWQDVRKEFGFLAEQARVEGEAEHTPEYDRDPRPRGYVFPRRGKATKRVRVAVNYEGKTHMEDLLFVQETDAADANSKQSDYIKVGDNWFLKSEHPTPQRYETDGRSDDDRTHWRLVYPYYEFQSRSTVAPEVARKLQDMKDSGAPQK